MTSGYADIAFALFKAMQLALAVLQNNLSPGAILCPVSADIDTVVSTTYHYIVIGGGTAGSRMAANLACSNKSVLLLEAGDVPPIESFISALFPFLPYSDYDYQYDKESDGYSCQNLKTHGVITAGKMLGGSSGLDHMMHITPRPLDYDSYWKSAANDSSWSYSEFGPYFAKENGLNETRSCNSYEPNDQVLLTKQNWQPEASILSAYAELGIEYKNETNGLGVTKPLFTIGNHLRQGGAMPYLNKIRNRNNVDVLTGAVVNKINIENKTATGVQFTYKGLSYTVNSTGTVVLSAGTIKSPLVLMFSGIGDPKVLAKLGITPIVNNTEVGNNLMDNPGVPIGFALDKTTETPAAVDLTTFPIPALTSFSTFGNGTCDTLDVFLYFAANSKSQFLQLCTMVLKYNHKICDSLYEYNINRNFFTTIISLTHPLSTGSVTPTSTNITDKPIIKMPYLSNSDDLLKLATHAMSMAELVNTTALKSFGAEIAYMDDLVCQNETKNTLEFWKCYVSAMTSPMWHFCGTCAMGKVVNSKLMVPGIANLRVVDASVMPNITVSKIGSAVPAIANKASYEILKEDGFYECIGL